MIHTFKFYYFDVPSEDVKHEVVSFLYMNMHKFTEGKERHLVISVSLQRIILFYTTITIIKNLNNILRVKKLLITKEMLYIYVETSIRNTLCLEK